MIMKWIENCNIITPPILKHGKMYRVRISTEHEIDAMFNVYLGGEEVAFILPLTGKELSVTHFLG